MNRGGEASMTSSSRTVVLLTVLCAVASACGDGGNDCNNNAGGTTPTAARTPGRTATGVVATTTAASPSPGGTPGAPPCPIRVTYIVNGDAADLDTGWTGIYHDTPTGVGGSLSLALNCPGATLGSCGACAISGPVTSTTTINNRRCVNASNVTCTSDADCPGSTCSFFFGPQVPISAGGFPVCFTNRIAGPVTGTVSPEGGTGESNLPIVAAIFSGISVEQPCPTCSGTTLESTGTCVGGDRDGMPCTVHGTTRAFGNVSFDCPASASANIGNLSVPFDLTTGTRTVQPGPTCTGPAGGTCWCGGQGQRNACNDGVCTVGADEEGVCNGGPVDEICAHETFRSCASNADCPASGDSCTMKTRECFGPTDASGMPTGAITRTGAASQAMPLQVGAFCLGATSSPAINTAAGYPGPGAIRLPTVVCIAEQCPSSPPASP